MEESLELQQQNDFESLKNHLFSLFHNLEITPPEELHSSSKKLHESLLNTSFYDLISQNLSLMGVLEYKLSASNYKTAINMLEDASFIADNSQNKCAAKINCFCKGYIFTKEKNYSEAFINLSNAKNIYCDESIFEDKIDSLMKEIEIYKDFEMPKSSQYQKPLAALLNVARTMSAETSLDLLINTVAQEIKKVLDADRCSVFLLDKENHQLWSKIALGIESQELRFEADKGIAGYVVRTGETVNIENAYEDSRFNREVDTQTGYKTKTLLCMPMRNMKHEILGVFQVLNKINGNFTKEDEELLIAIGSSVGIAIENSRLFEAQQKMIDTQKQLFKSFIDTLSASIDARDKITAGHSGRVKMYAELICDNMALDKSLKDNITDAAILHDIGKIGTRDDVLQKEGKLTDEEYKHIQEHVKITYDILNKVYLSEEFKEVAEIASSHHEKFDGSGYFRKLSENHIHIGGRILAVSDVFDAITSKRHYRDKMPVKNALDIIKSGAGNHFDPDVVEAFFNIKLDRLVHVFLSEVDSVLKYEDEQMLSAFDIRYLFDLVISKEYESFNEHEKYFFDIFNTYYNCKSGN